MGVTTSDDVVDVVVDVVEVLLSVDPLLFPQPTASASIAAPPTIVILVLDAVLDANGIRSLTLNSATLRFTRNPLRETADISGVALHVPG